MKKVKKKKIIIACDSYKGCLSSREVNEAIASGVKEWNADMYFGRIIGLSLIYRFGGYKAKQHEEVDTSRFGK
jgi:hypothetical protein